MDGSNLMGQESQVEHSFLLQNLVFASPQRLTHLPWLPRGCAAAVMQPQRTNSQTVSMRDRRGRTQNLSCDGKRS